MSLHLAHLHMAPIVGPVVVDPVPGHDLLADQPDHLLGGGRAMGAGGTQQLDPVGSRTRPFELGEQGGAGPWCWASGG